MCNFLTNPEMTAAFETELRELARSLTPGGVLLVLGSATPGYDPIYAAIDRTVRGRREPQLKQVLNATFHAQDTAEPHSIVASQIISSLDKLRRTVPTAFELVRPRLHKSLRGLNPAELDFPWFKALAYKREGQGTIPRRDRRRIRRSAPDTSEPTS